MEVDNGDGMDLPVGKDAVNRLIQENSKIFSDGHCKVCSAVLISESQKLAHYQSKKHASKYRRYLTIQGETVAPVKRRADSALDASDEADRNKCCPVCNMTFSSPVVATSHYEGKTHAKNLRMKVQGGVKEAVPLPKKPRLTPAAPDKNTGTVDESDTEKFCQLCKATFNNPHMAQQHYAGKKHKKQETKSKLMTIYTSCGNALPQTTPLKPLTPGSASTGNGFTCDICDVVVNSIAQYEAHISGNKHKTKASPKTGCPSGVEVYYEDEEEDEIPKPPLECSMPKVTSSMDRFSPSNSTSPYPARGPSLRISSSSASLFSSSGFYATPPCDIPPPPQRAEPMPQMSSGLVSGLLPLPLFASQSFAQKAPPYASKSSAHKAPPFASKSSAHKAPPFASKSSAHKTPPYSSKSSAHKSPPYASQSSARDVPPYASQSSARDVPPYASQSSARDVPPYVSQSSACDMPPYASQRSARDMPPYASQSSARDMPPYSSQSSARDMPPYSSQSSARDMPPYSSQSSARDMPPYASQSSARDMPPYSSQSSARDMPPYASQSSARDMPPYASQSSARDMPPYASQSSALDMPPYSSQSSARDMPPYSSQSSALDMPPYPSQSSALDMPPYSSQSSALDMPPYSSQSSALDMPPYPSQTYAHEVPPYSSQTYGREVPSYTSQSYGREDLSRPESYHSFNQDY
ncbi:zinc finger protein 346 [Mantella aurantiaca]